MKNPRNAWQYNRFGRDCTLIDLNTQYAVMAINRIKDDAPLFAEVAAPAMGILPPFAAE
jgi:hypothetical protein